MEWVALGLGLDDLISTHVLDLGWVRIESRLGLGSDRVSVGMG